MINNRKALTVDLHRVHSYLWLYYNTKLQFGQIDRMNTVVRFR